MSLGTKLNKVWIGLVIGLGVPFIALTAYYLVRYGGLSLPEFVRNYRELGILTHIISLAVLPDLLVFFLFIRGDHLRAARGVLMATFLFTFLVIVIRFL